MIAYKGVPQIVEKEKTLILSRIIHRNQNGTWLGKGKSIKKFQAFLLPCIPSNHDGSPGGQHYGTIFLGMANCITFRMYAVFNISLKFLTVIS